MGTSRSSEWTATALVFSGRANPKWKVPPGPLARLLALWSEMMPGGRRVSPAALGYRGLALSAPDNRRWTAYGGSVTLVDDSGSETRLDPDQQWERVLLGTAPPGLLPPVHS
jgi:hypothetical protein